MVDILTEVGDGRGHCCALAFESQWSSMRDDAGRPNFMHLTRQTGRLTSLSDFLSRYVQRPVVRYGEWVDRIYRDMSRDIKQDEPCC